MSCVKFEAGSVSACAAAEASSTSAAFCCVTSSTMVIALFPCSMPGACSRLELAISAITSVTFFTLTTISASALPDSSTSLVPSDTLHTESWIRVLISLAASALREARFLTSEATTAKPRPCSPARAASSAPFGLLARRRGELIGLGGIVRIVLDRRGHLLHRRSRLLEAGGLLLGALAQVRVAARNLLRPRTHLGRRPRHAPHHVGHVHQQAVHTGGQCLEESFLALLANACGQVPIDRLGDDRLHFLFRRHLLRPVHPLHHGADPLAGAVDHRVRDDPQARVSPFCVCPN